MKWKPIAVIAVVAILSVYVYNQFIAPKTGLPTTN